MKAKSFCYKCNAKRVLVMKFKPVFENHGCFDTVSIDMSAVCEVCDHDAGPELSIGFSTFIYHKAMKKDDNV